MRKPRIAEGLLRGFISDPALEDAILGDLAEEWRERAESAGGAAARGWYRRQVLRSVPHLLRQWWLQQSPARAVRTLGRVAVVLLLAVALIAVTTVGMLIVAGGAPGQPGPDVTRAMLIAGGAGLVLRRVSDPAVRPHRRRRGDRHGPAGNRPPRRLPLP